jgi:hypothetical protein
MSVRNIAKGYIGSNNTTASGVTLPLSFMGGISTTVQATFLKQDKLITLSLPAVMGVPTSTIIPSALLPTGYGGMVGLTQSSLIYVTSFDSTGTNTGTFPGNVTITSTYIAIRTSGAFVADGSTSQGSPSVLSIVYLCD